MTRFMAIIDPLDQWCVFDELAGHPLTFDGIVMAGLKRDEAISIAAKLEAIARWASCAPGDPAPPPEARPDPFQSRRAVQAP